MEWSVLSPPSPNANKQNWRAVFVKSRPRSNSNRTGTHLGRVPEGRVGQLAIAVSFEQGFRIPY